jgi:chemotaxis protein histidine kinase CheA
VIRLTEAQRAEFDALRQSYEAELPDKLGLIAGAVEVLRAGGWDRSDLQAFYLLVHRLTGSAAIYGYDGISRAAGDVETWVLAALEGGVPEPRRAELFPLVSSLQEAFAAGGKSKVRRRASPPHR